MLKKLAIFFLILNTKIVVAQIDKGTLNINGSVAFKTGEIKYDYESIILPSKKYKILELSPSFNYFILKRLSIGLNTLIKIDATKEKLDNEFKYTTNDFMIGPQIKGYLKINSCYPFILLCYLYQRNTLESKPENDNQIKFKYRYRGEMIKIGFGGAFFVSKTVAIEPIFSYNIYNYVTKESYYPYMVGNMRKEKYFDLGIGFSHYF